MTTLDPGAATRELRHAGELVAIALAGRRQAAGGRRATALPGALLAARAARLHLPGRQQRRRAAAPGVGLHPGTTARGRRRRNRLHPGVAVTPRRRHGSISPFRVGPPWPVAMAPSGDVHKPNEKEHCRPCREQLRQTPEAQRYDKDTDHEHRHRHPPDHATPRRHRPPRHVRRHPQGAAPLHDRHAAPRRPHGRRRQRRPGAHARPVRGPDGAVPAPHPPRERLRAHRDRGAPAARRRAHRRRPRRAPRAHRRAACRGPRRWPRPHEPTAPRWRCACTATWRCSWPTTSST